MFPKKIFQTWKEKEIKNARLALWQQTWQQKNPLYEYTIWDDSDNRNFIKSHFPSFLPIYDGYDVNIKRVDAVRYFYLFKYGGIYADIDFVCLKSFDDIMMQPENYDVLLGFLGQMDEPSNSVHDIPNALMIAKPESDFFSFVIQVLQNMGNIPALAVELATGPIFLKLCLTFYTLGKSTSFLEQYYGKNIFDFQHHCTLKSAIGLADPCIFYPINWDRKDHLHYRRLVKSPEELSSTFPQSYAVTYWMHSW